MPGYVAIGSFGQYSDLSTVPTHRQLRGNSLIEHLRKSVPFKQISVGGLDLEGYNFGYGDSVDTDMPPAYIDSYFAEKMNLVDPIVVAGKSQMTPLTEEEAYDLSPPPQRLLYLMRAYEVRNRALIPIARGNIVYGGVCFTNSQPFTPGEFEFLTTAAGLIHREITRPLMERFAASSLRLTAGELHCLRLASQGMTSEEIAKAGPYRSETVNSYLKAATRKLGAANRTHAVALAVRRHLLD